MILKGTLARMGRLRGAIAPLLKNLPLPLDKGKGIEGIRFLNP
jgi:hypothetical protein